MNSYRKQRVDDADDDELRAEENCRPMREGPSFSTRRMLMRPEWKKLRAAHYLSLALYAFLASLEDGGGGRS